MSAVFKNAKKKVSQTELRRFMNEHKTKQQGVVKKIDSPLAKYNDSGQLTCVLCKSVVRSEAVWTVHINAKQHKENVELARKLKEETNNFTNTKRSMPPPTDVPPKRLKSILKNSKNKTADVPDDFEAIPIPAPAPVVPIKSKSEEQPKPSREPQTVDDTTPIPEGFFDDPILDAKARNLVYKDPVEEEWEKFQKEMREVNSEADAIIAEDQEEATTERQIDEIDEQMRNWSRVLHLEKKKEEVVTNVITSDSQMEVDSSSDEEDFDEYLDWRAKKAYG